jgi:hypothetical protein
MVKVTVPSAEDTAKKWAEETPRRSTYYEANTPPAAGKWEANTKAAGANFKAAVQATNIEALFKGGVTKAGAGKFERKVKALAGRFGPGVSAAVDDMKTNVAPFLTEIAAVDLKERKPRGDASNYERVKTIGDKLHSKRLALLAAGTPS